MNNTPSCAGFRPAIELRHSSQQDAGVAVVSFFLSSFLPFSQSLSLFFFCCVHSHLVLQTWNVCEQRVGPAASSRRVGSLGSLQCLFQVLWWRNPEHKQGLQQTRVRRKHCTFMVIWLTKIKKDPRIISAVANHYQKAKGLNEQIWCCSFLITDPGMEGSSAWAVG